MLITVLFADEQAPISLWAPKQSAWRKCSFLTYLLAESTTSRTVLLATGRGSTSGVAEKKIAAAREKGKERNGSQIWGPASTDHPSVLVAEMCALFGLG